MPTDKQDNGQRAGFKVSDRRSFAESAEAKVDKVEAAEAAAPPAPEPTPPMKPDPSPQPAGAAPDEQDSGPLPPVDFHTFILSLGSSALLHLGELDAPDGRESRPDLRMAKHTIDIIGMLQEKTRGNLSPPEDRLLESLLYDLRLRFVERGKQ
jgi:hypothetical protein